jgi:hypothetical protein
LVRLLVNLDSRLSGSIWADDRRGGREDQDLAGGPEPLVPLFQEIRTWPSGPLPGKFDSRVVDPLKSVLQGWPVYLLEDIASNLNKEVRANSNDVLIKGSVVYRAHRHSVRNDGLASIGVLSNVGSVEKFGVAETAKGALRAVGDKHTLAEDRLMQTAANDGLGILATERHVGGMLQTLRSWPVVTHDLVKCKNELSLALLFSDEPNGVDSRKQTGRNPDEPGERLVLGHCNAKCDVVVSIGVCSAPLVSVVAIRTLVVFVWSLLRPSCVGGSNRECGWKAGYYSDSPHVLQKGQLVAVEFESVQFCGRHTPEPAI